MNKFALALIIVVACAPIAMAFPHGTKTAQYNCHSSTYFNYSASGSPSPVSGNEDQKADLEIECPGFVEAESVDQCPEPIVLSWQPMGFSAVDRYVETIRLFEERSKSFQAEPESLVFDALFARELDEEENSKASFSIDWVIITREGLIATTPYRCDLVQ